MSAEGHVIWGEENYFWLSYLIFSKSGNNSHNEWSKKLTMFESPRSR